MTLPQKRFRPSRTCVPSKWAPTSANKWASGCGCLRRPPTQPATTVRASVEECGSRSRTELGTKQGRFGGP